MGVLKGFAGALLLGLAAPLHAQVALWSAPIEEASRRFGIPVSWIDRVMSAESAGRTQRHGRPITSHAGAMGLMQVMPGTWRAMRAQHGLGADPHHPRDNILAGTAYLRAMYDRFGYPGLFAAYNAGPARYAQHLAGRPLPMETRHYLAKVAPEHRSNSAAAARVAPVVLLQQEAQGSLFPREGAEGANLFAIRR